MLAILTALALTQTGIAAEPAEDAIIAETYMRAYQDLDFDRLATLYAEDAVFIDPTSGNVAPITPPIHWQGADSIIAGLHSWGAQRMTYTLERHFNASGRFIYEGRSDVIYATPEGERTWRFPIVTIITVEDGQVTEHRDYTDYDSMQEISGTP